MFDFFLMIVCCSLLAWFVEIRTREYATVHMGVRKDTQSKFICLAIVIWAILFAGLRTRYNDTYNYIQSFNLFASDEVSLKMLFEPYGGFELFQSLIKKLSNGNPQVLIFLSSLICCGLTIPFIIRNTKHFSASIFWLFINDYLFYMAGIKQAMAMAIALWAIDAYFNKKYVRAVIILLVAMCFHPYIICLCCVPFLTKKCWDFKTIIISLVFAIAFVNLESLFGLLSAIGKDYSESTFDDYTINPFRVAVEFIPVAISFIWHKKIREENDAYLTLGVNMRIVSFVFIFLGLFFNPIYLGRMSTYFSMLSFIAIPKMVNVAFRNNKYRRILSLGFYAFFTLYFLLDLTKLGTYSLFKDQFKHVSIFELFS